MLTKTIEMYTNNTNFCTDFNINVFENFFFITLYNNCKIYIIS